MDVSLKGGLADSIRRHIEFTLAIDPDLADRSAVWIGLAHSVRDRLVSRWLASQRACYELLAKRAYYLSMEFLPGRFLRNYLAALGMEAEAQEALRSMGYELEDLEEEEWDPGLGNGGLGRLASCFLDSMATLKIPGTGYGIRYDFGIFHQRLVDGYQKEEADNWRRSWSPWEIQRPEVLYRVQFNGRSESYRDADGELRFRWSDTESVLAMASDILIPGFSGGYVSHMRLWVAHSSREFNLAQFNVGDYVGAVESKVFSENISKVLYPSDEIEQGKELRLRQQHFFVSATLQDIIRRFKKQHRNWSSFSDFVAIQLNDTHPALAVPELMRLLMDEEGLGWEEAWSICQATFGYTNHTVLPEALETWPVDMLGRILPRHLQIIFEINGRFLGMLNSGSCSDPELPARVSLVQEGSQRRVRMANLAVVGSHSVNGVAALHSKILRESIFRDFDEIFPGRLRNVTNGVTPRRFLFQANPALSELITSEVGPEWILDLNLLAGLTPLAENAGIQDALAGSSTAEQEAAGPLHPSKNGTGRKS